MFKYLAMIAFILGRNRREKEVEVATFKVYYKERNRTYTLDIQTPTSGSTHFAEENLSDTELFDLLRRQAVASVAIFHTPREY